MTSLEAKQPKTTRNILSKSDILNVFSPTHESSVAWKPLVEQFPDMFSSLIIPPENSQNQQELDLKDALICTPPLPKLIKPSEKIPKKRIYINRSPFTGSGYADTPTLRVWYYLDENNKIQGPFTSIEMDHWFDCGFFFNELLIRFKEQNSFVKLIDLFGKVEYLYPIYNPQDGTETWKIPSPVKTNSAAKIEFSYDFQTIPKNQQNGHQEISDSSKEQEKFPLKSDINDKLVNKEISDSQRRQENIPTLNNKIEEKIGGLLILDENNDCESNSKVSERTSNIEGNEVNRETESQRLEGKELNQDPNQNADCLQTSAMGKEGRTSMGKDIDDHNSHQKKLKPNQRIEYIEKRNPNKLEKKLEMKKKQNGAIIYVPKSKLKSEEAQVAVKQDECKLVGASATSGSPNRITIEQDTKQKFETWVQTIQARTGQQILSERVEEKPLKSPLSQKEDPYSYSQMDLGLSDKKDRKKGQKFSLTISQNERCTKRYSETDISLPPSQSIISPAKSNDSYFSSEESFIAFKKQESPNDPNGFSLFAKNSSKQAFIFAYQQFKEIEDEMDTNDEEGSEADQNIRNSLKYLDQNFYAVSVYSQKL